MSVHFKPEVRFTEAQAIAVLLNVADEVFGRYGYPVWITAAKDGKHKSDSFHYKGLAMDFRTKHVDKIDTRYAIHKELQLRLAPQFDVIFENPEGANEHIHVEYDT